MHKSIETKQPKNQELIWNELAPSVEFTIEPDFYKFQKFVSKKSRVLDFGCGYGRVAKKLKDIGYKNIIGIDSSLEMIKRGVTEYPELDLRYASSSQSLVGHEKFDAIIFCATLTCMPEVNIRKSSVEMAYSMLTDDGIIYCCEFAKTSNTEYSKDGCFESGIGIKMKHFLVEELAAELKEFKKLSLSVEMTSTISGSLAQSIHYFGKKTALI